MHSFAQHLYAFFAHLGGFGLLLMGLADSSFLILPLGNDILIVGLTAQHPDRFLYYILMALIGSIGGCLLLDWLARSGGEKWLRKFTSKRQFEYVKKHVEERAGLSLLISAAGPPPTPFSPVVAGVAAFQYPRRKMYGILIPARLVRLSIPATLAHFYGRHILQLADNAWVHRALLALVTLYIAATIYTLIRWWRQGRQKADGGPGENAAAS